MRTRVPRHSDPDAQRESLVYEASKALHTVEEQFKTSERETERLRAKVVEARARFSALLKSDAQALASMKSAAVEPIDEAPTSNGAGRVRPSSEPWMMGRSRKDKVILLLGEQRRPMDVTEIAQMIHESEEASVRYCVADLCSKKARLLHKPVRGMAELTDAGRAEYTRLLKYRLNTHAVTAATN